jgi:hypothetical protein
MFNLGPFELLILAVIVGMPLAVLATVVYVIVQLTRRDK